MDQLFSRPVPKVTWAYLWPCLLLALALRIGLGLSPIIYVHPDQVFQYLEPGYRLANGFGLITWEWIYGIRSWMIPFGVAGVIELSNLIGVPHHVLVLVVFSIISLAIPLGVYRLAQALLPESQAIAAFLIGCFWGYFLHYGSTPMTTMLAACALIWAAVLMMRPPTPTRLLYLGALLAIALAIRYQLIPMIGLLGLFSLYVLRRDFLWVLGGGLLVLIPVGLLDLFTWGGFLFSFIENFRLNFTEGLSEIFGTDPWWFYGYISFIDTGGIYTAMLIGMLLMGRNGWPIWVAVFVGILFYHIPAHKEFRFLTFAMSFGAIGFVHLSYRLMKWVPILRRFTAAFMPFWMAVASVIYLLFQYELFNVRRVATDATAVMKHLHDAPDVQSVVALSPQFTWWRTGGYYTLDRAVPVYFFDGRAILESGTPVSHVVVETGDNLDGFTKVLVQGDLALLRRDDMPADTPPEQSFDFFANPGFIDRISTAPITPRFPPTPTGFP